MKKPLTSLSLLHWAWPFALLLCMGLMLFFIKLELLMTDDEIRHYYDTHLNMTLKELSQMTGKSIAELKKIILSQP
jgi:hypothetical protein